MKWLSVLVCLGCLGFAGCKKKTSTAESAPAAAPDATQAATPEAAPASAPRAKGAPAPAALPPESQVLVGAVHTFMTDQLRIFVQQYGRMPSTFAEFSSARMDSVPRPPEGMKYVIDPTTVEVKVVPK